MVCLSLTQTPSPTQRNRVGGGGWIGESLRWITNEKMPWCCEFTLHNETGLMHIQTGLIHFGRVHTESILSETGFKPIWSQSTSRCGLNADSNRFQNNCVGGNVMSCDQRMSHIRNYSTSSLTWAVRLCYKLSIHTLAIVGGWMAQMTCTLVSVQGQLTFRVSWTKWFRIEWYAREHLYCGSVERK